MKPQLKPYMASADEPSEGAILVFAHNVKEAKKVAWQSYSFIHEICDSEYINLRVSWMKGCDYMLEQADQEKLKKGESHIVETPISCKGCELWGLELDEKGYCESCAESIKCENCQQKPEPNGEIDCFKCTADLEKAGGKNDSI